MPERKTETMEAIAKERQARCPKDAPVTDWYCEAFKQVASNEKAGRIRKYIGLALILSTIGFGIWFVLWIMEWLAGVVSLFPT